LARPTSIWLRSADNHWYVTVDRKKIKLSLEKKEATRLFHELLSKHQEPSGSNVSPSFRKLADLFVDESQRTKKDTSYRIIKYGLQSFCDHIGQKRIADLKVHHVSTWVGEHQRPSKEGEKTRNGKHWKRRVPWNDSTACTHRTNLLACLNWAVNQGYIQSHPLTKLKRGTHSRRERYLTLDERKKIRENVKPDFADFLIALDLTGARPFSELATITAEMIDWQTKTIRFKHHKTEKKGKSRTIYISPPLAELLKRKIVEHPTGLLFRNQASNIWKSHDATRRLRYVTDKLGIPRATIYAYRHAMISDSLAKGLSANVIGELVGNSPIVIARNYDKLHQKPDVMLEAAARAAG
jgi:integrase